MACFFCSRSDVFLTAMQHYKQMTPFVCRHATAISALYIHTCVGAESTDHSTLIKLLKIRFKKADLNGVKDVYTLQLKLWPWYSAHDICILFKELCHVIQKAEVMLCCCAPHLDTNSHNNNEARLFLRANIFVKNFISMQVKKSISISFPFHFSAHNPCTNLHCVAVYLDNNSFSLIS